MATQNEDTFFEFISACRICGSTQLTTVLDLGCQPPANALYDPCDDEPLYAPLQLLRCEGCSTVQLSVDVNPEYLFSNYLWVTGTSRVANEYAATFVAWCETFFSAEKKSKLVVEIASNDGTLLKEFLKVGWDVLGVDPASNICEIARSQNVPTECMFFDSAVAQQFVDDGLDPDLVVARNVIPHVKNIHGVIAGMAKLLATGGIGVIEFHKSSLLIEQLQYDYIYHEHLFYFSLGTISNLLLRHNLWLFDVRESPISGGSWVVYFSVEQLPASDRLVSALSEEEQQGINELRSWEIFADQVIRHKHDLVAVLNRFDKPMLAYGASARSSTLVNWCGLTQLDLCGIVDKNEMKVGLLAPGCKVPVFSFTELESVLADQEVILLLAWNFRDEIIQELRALGYRGQFVIPLPLKVQII